ncbi:MAG: hypothetical protein IAF08_06840 [Rhizobacter sp.]|nr:hypothetical protein [Chlorobiales bacterium]
MKKISALAISTLLLAVLVQGCNTSTTAIENGDSVSGIGTITYLNFEGGFYGIVADGEKKYDPVSLPEEFKQDGLKVKFDAQIKRGAMSIRQWGKIVEIRKIEKL